MPVLPHALHLRWPIAFAPLVAVGVAAIWLGSAPSITDRIRPASLAGSSSAASGTSGLSGTASRRHAAQQAELAADGQRRSLRVILLYGMGGHPMGLFK
jgi:hypothetical protein